MGFRDFLRVLRRHALIVLVCTALSVVLAAVLTAGATPRYQSTSAVYISSAQHDTSDAYAGGLLSEQRAAGYVELVKSRLLAQRVQKAVGGTTVGDLMDRVDASVINDTPVVELTVTGDDPRQAQKIAQAYADALVDAAVEIETPAGQGTSPINATVIDPASYDDEAVWPRPLLNFGLAGIFGLLLGVGLALLREHLDTTVTSVEQLGPEPPALMAAIAGESGGGRERLVTELDPGAPRAEAFRVLRTNIQFLDVDQPHKVLVVTSPAQGEGKTSVAVNLALSLARAGIKTLLLDGDLRRPRIAEVLGLVDSIGVTSVLLGRVDFTSAIQRHAVSDLDVLTSGTSPPNASELLQSEAMARLLERARERYDVVVVDSPPLLPVTDAALLAAQADGALLVVRHGGTTREQWAASTDRLAQVGASVAGVVMNMVPASRSALGYPYRPYQQRGRRRRGRSS